MSDYAKVAIRLKYSEASDYSDPNVNEQWDLALTPDEIVWRTIEVDTSAMTLEEVGDFGTLTSLAVKNLDATNYVTLTWLSAGNGATPNITRIAAGKAFFTTDITSTASGCTIQANSAAVECQLWITGT